MRKPLTMAATFMTIAFAAPAAAEECDAAHARSVNFAEATGDVPLQSCVAIEGIVVGRMLVEDGRARYRPERRENDPSSSGAILGLYSRETFEQPTRVRVVGIVSDCASTQARILAADSQAIWFPSGYCHSYHGRTLSARSVTTLGPAPLTRLLRTDAGDDLGNLSPLAEGDVHRQMWVAAQRLLVAIRSDHRVVVAAMHGGGAGGARSPSELTAAERLIFDDDALPFAALRGRGDVRIQIFGWRAPLWADAEWHAARARTGTAEAIACFSAHPNAAALWPIDSKDADNVPGRPYACTRIILSGTGADAPARFDTHQARGGLAEPR